MQQSKRLSTTDIKWIAIALAGYSFLLIVVLPILIKWDDLNALSF